VARVELLEAVAEVFINADGLFVNDITGVVALETETAGGIVVPFAEAPLELWADDTTGICDELETLSFVSDTVL